MIAAGSGLLPRLWLGKRVACAAPTAGAWAEYLVTRAALCVPLQSTISFEQGAMLLVNPMTALAFFDIARQGNHAAIVNTAAASALGRMILRLGLRHRVPVIHVVRRQEQVDSLRSLGAQFVLVLRDIRRVQSLAATDLRTTVQKRLPLSAVQQAVELYQRNMSAGKVILVADPDKVHVDG